MFKPFVCGSLGGFSDDAVKVMKDIGKSSSAVLGVTEGVAVDHIRSALLSPFRRLKLLLGFVVGIWRMFCCPRLVVEGQVVQGSC